jgi:protein SCO1/2
MAGETTQSYPARGVIEDISSDHRQVKIHHQAIPGYMMEMTMDFPVRDTNELSGLAVGDQVTFSLIVEENDDWVENLRRVGHSTEPPPMSMTMPSEPPPELKPGDLVPDGEFLAENGRQIHLSDFRGRAVAFTFFFTRCPLPNYCPLMNRNFAAAQRLMAAAPNGPTNWQFLSISFDPGFDTPDTLANYAGLYRTEDASHWLFAAASINVLTNLAPQLGLMIMHSGTNISHNLRTVVIDRNGIIFQQFDGNTWTPQELADALRRAAAK